MNKQLITTYLLFLSMSMMVLRANAQNNAIEPECEVYAVPSEFSPTDGQAIQATSSVMLTFGTDGNWKSSTISPIAFSNDMKYYITGNNNPKDGELNSSNASTGSSYSKFAKNLPKSGTFFMLRPSKAGRLKVAVVVNKDKPFYVTDSNGNCLNSSVTLTNTDNEEITLNENDMLSSKLTGFVSFSVEVNETYYLFCTGSKVWLGGFYFSASHTDNYIRGDADGDGDVTITDAVKVVNYILGIPVPNFNYDAANVNGDKSITISDAVGIINTISSGDVTNQSKMYLIVLAKDGTRHIHVLEEKLKLSFTETDLVITFNGKNVKYPLDEIESFTYEDGTTATLANSEFTNASFIGEEKNLKVGQGIVDNGRFIRINTSESTKPYFINEIDSITYSFADTYLQMVWIGKNRSESNIKEIESVSLCSSSDIQCSEYQDENVQFGLIANTGDYLFVMKPEKTNNVILLNAGNTLAMDKSIVCQVDSFGVIRKMHLDGVNYAIFYEEGNIVLVGDNNTVTKAPYSIFENLNESAPRLSIHRAGGITDSWQFKTISYLRTIYGIVNGQGVAARMALYLAMRAMDYFDPDGADIRRLAYDGLQKDFFNIMDMLLLLIEKLDEWEDKLTFGDMNIETLDAEKKGVTKYEVGCKINYSTTNYLYADYPHTYRITMKIDSHKKHWTEEKTDLSPDGVVKFDLSGLAYNTEYSYQPRLDVVFYNSYLDEFVTVSEILKRSGLKGYKFGEIPPYSTRYLIGTTKSFMTGYPGCNTGDVVSCTTNSAVVKCSYSDIDEYTSCGIVVSGDDGEKIISTSSTDGEREITISGLSPGTTYNYWAYVEVGDVPENGQVKSFTTEMPDISGTWSCTVTHYNLAGTPQYINYSITLEKDGSVKCSNSSEIYSSGWSFLKDGTVSVNIMDFATTYANSGQVWEGKVDDINNPHKITGLTYRWNYNNIGSFQGDADSFEMSR